MTIVYIPVNVENEMRHKQQMRKAAQMFEEGWLTQGIMPLTDIAGCKIEVMVFFKEDG